VITVTPPPQPPGAKSPLDQAVAIIANFAGGAAAGILVFVVILVLAVLAYLYFRSRAKPETGKK
jgi:hypothetical protein